MTPSCSFSDINEKLTQFIVRIPRYSKFLRPKSKHATPLVASRSLTNDLAILNGALRSKLGILGCVCIKQSLQFCKIAASAKFSPFHAHKRNRISEQLC